jgi:hypothetical protein
MQRLVSKLLPEQINSDRQPACCFDYARIRCPPPRESRSRSASGTGYAVFIMSPGGWNGGCAKKNCDRQLSAVAIAYGRASGGAYAAMTFAAAVMECRSSSMIVSGGGLGGDGHI